MRVTVFGASGRTGRPVVGQALDRGHEVVAFVRDAAARANVAEFVIDCLESELHVREMPKITDA